jgi:hypothetical protein
MAKSAIRHKKLDIIGTIVAYQPIWSTGFPVLVSVSFTQQSDMDNFMSAKTTNIDYVDDASTTPIPWPKQSFVSSFTQPLTIGVAFTALEPNQLQIKPMKQRRRFHGTGNGTIIYTDAMGKPHQVGSQMRFVELQSLDAATFQQIYHPE